MKIRYLFPVALILFVGGLVSFLVSASSRPPGAPSSFVLTHVRYLRSAPEKKTFIVRFVQESGASFEKLLAPDGTDRRQIQTKYTWQGSSDADFRASPYFVRTDTLFGLTAYVSRQPMDGGETVETWQSRETGPVVLKLIIEKPNGDAIVEETTNLEFRPISPEEVVPNPDLLMNVSPQTGERIQ